MSEVVQLPLFIQLNEDAAEKRSYLNVVRIIIAYFLDDFVGLAKVLLEEALLSLDVTDLVGFILV